MTSPSKSLPIAQPEQVDLFAMLKRETFAVHEKVMAEPWAKRVLSSDYSRREYVELLQKYCGFYLPLETQLLALPSSVFHRLRVKHPLLQEDLIFLTTTKYFDSAVCTRLPQIVDVPSALGICYVLEGATLGGQMIAKHLKISLKLKGPEGLKFFNGYGPETAKMWHAFKDEARDIVRNPQESEAMRKAALDTFTCLSDWMEAS